VIEILAPSLDFEETYLTIKGYNMMAIMLNP
jgi:hypothetical protein